MFCFGRDATLNTYVELGSHSQAIYVHSNCRQSLVSSLHSNYVLHICLRHDNADDIVGVMRLERMYSREAEKFKDNCSRKLTNLVP